MKMLILACVLGLVGTIASADVCYDEALVAAQSKLEQQGLKPHSVHFDSIKPVGKDQHEVNYDIKLFYWTTLKNGAGSLSTDTKNFYVRMQLGKCQLIEAPQPSN